MDEKGLRSFVTESSLLDTLHSLARCVTHAPQFSSDPQPTSSILRSRRWVSLLPVRALVARSLPARIYTVRRSPLLQKSYLPCWEGQAQVSASSTLISCIAQRGLVGVRLSFGDAAGAIFAGFHSRECFFIDALALGRALRKETGCGKDDVSCERRCWFARRSAEFSIGKRVEMGVTVKASHAT
jgi:hypothetical protein